MFIILITVEVKVWSFLPTVYLMYSVSRLASLEEGAKIKWTSCLQPQCARCLSPVSLFIFMLTFAHLYANICSSLSWHLLMFILLFAYVYPDICSCLSWHLLTFVPLFPHLSPDICQPLSYYPPFPNLCLLPAVSAHGQAISGSVLQDPGKGATDLK